MYVELFAQVMDVILDRSRLDSQLAADLLVRQPAIEQPRDLQFAPRQRCAGDLTTGDVTTGITVAAAHGGRVANSDTVTSSDRVSFASRQCCDTPKQRRSRSR